MRQLRVSLGLIQKGEDYFLQLRGNDPAIGAAGLIGTFGGKIKLGEEPDEAVSREIGEETSLNTEPNDFAFIGDITVVSDYQNETTEIVASVFSLPLPGDTAVIAKEGELVIMTKEAALRDRHRLTPATRVVFEELI
jgi:ADP-ribose pyrophosphatase YjhB (NUDIX family)